MSISTFMLNHRRLLLGSAIVLGLSASPYSYDFAHQQWQVNHAFAGDGGSSASSGAEGHGPDGASSNDIVKIQADAEAKARAEANDQKTEPQETAKK